MEELLREDIAVQLRRRDGISDEEVREVIAAARAALSERCEPAKAGTAALGPPLPHLV